MATFFINTDLNTQTRFDIVKFIEFVGDNYDPLNSFILNNIKRLKSIGQYSIISEKRPDLISSILYGDTQYWWLIMLYNDIYDISDLVAGKIINYPSQQALENFYVRLFTLEKTKIV